MTGKVNIWLCIVIIILVIFCLVGCEEKTTITTQSETTVNNSTTTKETTIGTTKDIPIIATLTSDIIDSLGTGVQADIVFVKAGLESEWPQAGKHRFRVDQQTDTYCDIVFIKHNGALVIQSAEIIASDESKILFAPNPDTNVINDFQVFFGASSLDFKKTPSIFDLRQLLGEPQTTETSTMTGDNGSCRIMKLTFPGIQLQLSQLVDTSYPDNWGIDKIVFSDHPYTTPRGLKVGMTYHDVLHMLGTGDFNLYPDDLPNPEIVGVTKYDPENDGDDFEMNLQFEQRILSSITMIAGGP